MTNWKEEIRGYYNQQAEEYRQKQSTTQAISEEKRAEAERLHLERYRTTYLPEFQILDQLDVSTSLLEIRDQIWGCGEVFRDPTKNLETSHEFSATYRLEMSIYRMSANITDDYNVYKYRRYIKVSTDSKKLYVSSSMGQFPSPELDLNTNGYQARKEWLRRQLIVGCTFDRSEFREVIDHRILEYSDTRKALYKKYPETRPPRTFFEKLFGIDP